MHSNDVTKLAVVLVIASAFIALGQITICIVFLIAFAVYAFFTSTTLLIALFVILFPTDGVFLKEYNLLGVININIAVNALVTLKLLPLLLTRIKLTTIQKLAIQLVIVLLFYNLYIDWKGVVYSLTELDRTVNRTIFHIFKYLPLILLIKVIRREEVFHVVVSAIKIAAGILIVTALIAPLLAHTGLKVSIEDIELTGIPRYRGIYGEGDVNSFGIFCVMILGMILSSSKSIDQLKSKTNNIIIILSLLGIVISGSRAAVIALLTLFFMFGVYNNRKKNTIKYYLIALLIGGVLYPSVVSLQNRFDDFEQQVDIHNISGRVGKWYAYIRHISDNPSIMLMGNTSYFHLVRDEVRAAHNYYIETVYQSGLLPLLLISFIYMRMFLLFIKNNYEYPPLYYAIPILIGSMTVSALPGIGYFLLIASGNNQLIKEK